MQGRRQGIRNPYPVNRMDSFMFGHRPVSQPVGRKSFPTNLQQLHPTKLLKSPQITKGLSGLSGILNNVQQVLQVVETTTPLIKEYGPMVKNLPAMYRMMKAFKEVDQEESDEKPTGEVKEEEFTSSKDEKQDKHETKETNQVTKKQSRSGLSTPKLYV